MTTSLQSENLTTCGTIVGQQSLLADRIVARHYELRPDLASRYGERGRDRCVADAKRHLEALSQSIAAGRSALFVDYVAWAKIVLGSRGIPVQDLADNLEACRQTLDEVLRDDQAALADQYLLDSLSCLPELPSNTPSYLTGDRPLADLARRYLDALLNATRRDASEMVMDAVRGGTPVREIYLHVFQRSQYEIGRLWQSNLISVAQEHLCTAATQFIMSQLYPLIFATARKDRRVVATCVGGDLHELGIRTVADFFEMDGWDTFYLGADVPSASIVQTIIDRRADVLAVSATLMTHLGAVTELIASVRSNRACGEVIILVGGHPFNVAANLWREVGADGYAADALRTIDVADQLMLEKATPCEGP